MMNVVVSAEEGIASHPKPISNSSEIQFGEIHKILAQIDSAPENAQLDTRRYGTKSSVQSATEPSKNSTIIMKAHDIPPNKTQPAMGMRHMKNGMLHDPKTSTGGMGMGDM
tara:strand:+ start:478 stop:810 length:333 start_codon:yes stop_codon:yes gene_type:complete